MVVKPDGNTARYRALTRENITKSEVWGRLKPELQESIRVVSSVFPFRTNTYVTDQLIDWERVPEDPMYQLTFPQRGMLTAPQYRWMADLVLGGASPQVIKEEANKILEWLKREINEAWEKRAEIEPSYEGIPKPKVLEILKLLPRT